MNTIRLSTRALEEDLARVRKINADFRNAEIRMYCQLAGLVVGTALGVVVAFKRNNLI